MARLALTCVVVALAALPSHANPLLDALGFPADSGKIAKFEFRLRESFSVTAVAWSPDGRYIATASTAGNLVHIWNVQKHSLAKELRLEAGGSRFHNLSFSPDGRYLAVCGKPVLHVYATANWEDATTFSASVTGGCVRPVFASDGREMALLTWPRYVRVFSTPKFELIKSANYANWGRAQGIDGIDYLPGTHTLLLAGDEYVARGSPAESRVWVLRADEDVPGVRFQPFCCVADGHGGGSLVQTLAVSPDGHQIAAGTNEGSGQPSILITQAVHILDASDGKLLGAPLDGVDPIWPVHALAYTPNGRFIIVGNSALAGSVIHLIDAKALQTVDVIHVSPFIYDAAMSPDSKEFAVGAGGQILVWALSKQ